MNRPQNTLQKSADVIASTKLSDSSDQRPSSPYTEGQSGMRTAGNLRQIIHCRAVLRSSEVTPAGVGVVGGGAKAVAARFLCKHLIGTGMCIKYSEEYITLSGWTSMPRWRYAIQNEN